jgi:hypothetical protein
MKLVKYCALGMLAVVLVIAVPRAHASSKGKAAKKPEKPIACLFCPKKKTLPDIMECVAPKKLGDAAKSLRNIPSQLAAAADQIETGASQIDQIIRFFPVIDKQLSDGRQKLTTSKQQISEQNLAEKGLSQFQNKVNTALSAADTAMEKLQTMISSSEIEINAMSKKINDDLARLHEAIATANGKINGQ